MSFALLFYILLLLWVVLGTWAIAPNWRAGGPNLLLFVLFLILGWKVFGPPIHG